MLKLKNIIKTYDAGPMQVSALKGVSIEFRSSEFVAILGPSGCGKTTLLNIIGGLDQYTDGDLHIKGRSTKKFKSRDWDTYRNHSVGFVFQSYNLIPHQSILANVELALTLSGVKKAERRQRAIDALAKVGLADQIHKKPNQLSGGQMQRVAIARALVNDPEILLADEPTGALDTETSVQVMELLKEISHDRLVVMVTHNPELAEAYATRTVRLLDGQIISDSMPYDGTNEPIAADDGKKKASMSLLTAFSLSLSNLMTKKGRAILTAFAGSIGIIGIALILAISTGINNYVDDVERDTLSNYPLTLESQTVDMNALLTSMQPSEEAKEPEANTIYSANVMSNVMDIMFQNSITNDLKAFKKFIESDKSDLKDLTSEIRYIYSTPLNVYKADDSQVYQINPSNVIANIMGGDMGMSSSPLASQIGMGGSSMDVWNQLPGNIDNADDLKPMQAQYDKLTGRYPEKWNEVVLVVDRNNRVTDYTLYALGILDVSVLEQAIQKKLAGEDVTIDTEIKEYKFSDFVGMKFKLLPTTDYYANENGMWVDKSEDTIFMQSQLKKANEIEIVGILRPKEGSSVGAGFGTIGYRADLMTKMINLVNNSEIVKLQQANPNVDIFTGKPFADPNAPAVSYTLEQLMQMLAEMPEQQAQVQQYIAMMRQQGMTDDEIAAILGEQMFGASKSTLAKNLALLGVADLDNPSSINLYPKNFEAKEKIAQIINDYNEGKDKDDQIVYTDLVGIMMSSVTDIINAISGILIAFVAISLVVSSIMISIITNISVLERTKEIGILRAVGASKSDVSRVFNAETFIEGLAAGLVGIIITELLIIPINLIVQNVIGLDATAFLEPVAALILLGISVLLTFVAGLIPARSAAKKDPVVALRTE